MSELTETAAALRKTAVSVVPWLADLEEQGTRQQKLRKPMLQIIIPILIVAGLGYSLQTDRKGRQIAHTPYNDRYNDASGAREDHLG